MAIIHPFKAWRPDPQEVTEISSVPYDVISTEEAHQLAGNKPKSFIHVVRPEIDLPENVDIYDDSVYEKGAENLQRLMEEGHLKQDEASSLYIYRLSKGDSSQTGIFGCVSVEDYDNDVILKHELTRPAKEDDRTRHILTQSAHAEPVMMTYKDTAEIGLMTKEIINNAEPIYNFEDESGVRHTLWNIKSPQPFERAFGDIPNFYIADGHHRCKSASRVAEKFREQNSNHTGNEEYNFFPAVLFPVNEMNILPYNRILHDVSNEQWKKLTDKFELREDASSEPAEKGKVAIYRDGKWWGLQLPEKEQPNSVEKLDVARLQEYILQPIFGIEDQRKDKNLDFVGGIRGIGELEQRVDSGEVDMAISMYPTSIKELIEVSDEGRLMPPKSTWFEPKIRSGILVHSF
mgnify:CR=1 FL=1